MQHRVCRRLLATILLCVSLGAAADAVIDRAKQRLDRHDAEAQRAGDPEFDYLLGIAAAEHTRVDSYLELAFGYDTNVTSATPNSTIAIPVQGQHFAVDTSRYRMTGGLNVTGSGSACLSSCIAYVQGFFAGTTAERAGLGYQVSDFQAGKNIIGAAAFTR
jgi:hypothetical protein